jgi:hypothetical protein
MSTEISQLPYTAELPIRDVPRETVDHTIDPQTIPTYISPAEKYITPDKKENWEEYKLPILLSILYFLYNIPSLQKMIERALPQMLSDPTMSLMAKSAGYGLLYYLVTIGSVYLGK